LVARRARALFGAIVANPSRIERLEGSRVVSVDDVMTSGATTGACLIALKRADA
jgi:predicted amidophosphoribosyltransferase